MKRLVTFVCFFVALALSHTLVAQFSITLNVESNPTPKILEWAVNPQTVQLTVANLTSNTERYKIKAQLYKDNELIGETRIGASPLRIIEANAVEINFAEDVVPESAVKLYGNIEKTVIKTGRIPAGTYRLCTKLVDESGNIDLTTEVCQTFFVSSYQQPRLILPLDGSPVPYTGAVSSLNFQWSPVLPQPRFPVSYQIRLVPKFEGQTALYAFRYNTPVINETVPGSTNFIWPVNTLEIEPDTDYVWGVISMDEDEKPVGDNEGLSEIWGFRFVNNTITVRTGPVIQTSPGCPLQFSDFSLTDNEPQFEPGPQNFQEYANTPISEFFVYEFNAQTSFTPQPSNILQVNEQDIVFEIIESNIPLSFLPLHISFKQYAVIPLWNQSTGLNKDQIHYKIKACMTAELLEELSDEEILYWCSTEKCIDIEYTGSQYVDPNPPVTATTPNCDYLACSPDCANFAGPIFKDDNIKLCGDLLLKVLTVTSPNTGNSLTGTGSVRIPWLLTEIEVEFTNIKVNSNFEFCNGQINALKNSNPSQLPTAWAEDVGYKAIVNILKGLNTYIPIPDVVTSNAQTQTSPLTLPLGLNKFEGLENKGITLAITDMNFNPSENFLQAVAAIDFKQERGTTDTLCFKSDHFFFNGAGPIKSRGNSFDLNFALVKDIHVKYGTNNSDPIYIVFKKSDTKIEMTSTCNQPFNWCIKAAVDIEMPRSWLRPIPDDGTSKVKTSLNLDICNVNDVLLDIDLPNCMVTNTNGLELEVNDLTWDHSTKQNANGMTWPVGYSIPSDPNSFKGLYLKEAKIKLPADFSTHSGGRVEINLNDWIFHPDHGISGKVESYNVLEFDNNAEGLNVADLGASLDTFRLEMVKSTITKGYLTGKILLPICDNGSGNSTGHFEYKAFLASSSNNNTTNYAFSFTIKPINQLDCSLFDGGKLEIQPTSRLSLGFDDNKSYFEFRLNGKLEFSAKEFLNSPIELTMGANFENIKLDYSKPKNGDPVSFTFDHGDWSFASPQKLINNFPMNIENFKAVTNYNISGTSIPASSFYAGGVGFDFVVNVNESIGGTAGLKLIGYVEKAAGQKRITAKFHKIEVDKIKVYANLTSVKLNGEIEFRDTTIDQNTIKAAKGNLSAEFTTINAAVYAGAIFGRQTSITPSNPVLPEEDFRFFMVQAKAIFPSPGIPMLPGVAIRGIGAGFHKNMYATFPDSAPSSGSPSSSTLSSQTSATSPVKEAVYPGVTFVPQYGTNGLKLQLEIAATPKEESFNGSIGMGVVLSSSFGVSSINISGSVWAGAKIIERNNAFIEGTLEASYDFPKKEFLLGGKLKIDKPGLIYALAGFNFRSNGINNTFHFNFGTGDFPNDVVFLPNVPIFGNIASKSYFMFGNEGVIPPSDYIMEGTRTRIDAYSLYNPDAVSTGFALKNNVTNSNITTGKGFAAGLGIEFESKGSVSWLGADLVSYEVGAGAEFHLNMLDYGTTACGGHSPMGFNGYYLKSNLAAWAYATGWIGNTKIIELSALASINANFPNPWSINGKVYGNAEYLAGALSGRIDFDFSFGYNCFDNNVTPNLPTQNIQAENVADSIGNIFTNVYIDENEPYNPEQALKWTSHYQRNETFSLPERQSDGRVVNKIFEVKWGYSLKKKVINPNNGAITYEGVGYTTLGVDPIGRWCLAKDVDKWECPMFIGSNYCGRFPCGTRALAGDFNGDNFGDIIYERNDRIQGRFISFSNGRKFFGPYKVVGLLKDGTYLDFNKDGKTDVGYFNDDNGTFIIQTANKIIGSEFHFNSPTVFASNVNSNTTAFGDFNGDGYPDIANVESIFILPSTPSQYQFRVLGDTNHDNPPDDVPVEVAKYLRRVNVRIYESNNNIFLEPNIWYTDTITRYPNTRILVKDINLDNKYDLILHQPGQELFIYETGLISDDNLFILDENNDPHSWYGNKVFDDFNNDGTIEEWKVGTNVRDERSEDDVWFENYLTPYTTYQLTLDGSIKDISKNKTVTQKIITEFTTSESEKIQNKIDEYSEKIENTSSPNLPIKGTSSPKGSPKNIVINPSSSKN